ncbi:multicomponent Na+:H+ antiporter subunit A [Conyzicola lurida]|uniref:Multicomponent Na+:H+ antiporter subunit A n=1 Tax=Conyzicola lurida TaxID=1172621 RepID=A0A841AR90_9MICO|nr:Na+/H+ antiporter subunit A [Conyzicola lurida]MBB5844103.1 multicomponent Na+:H+ antiporter subunit A [Conyzicola lurida]
MIAILIAFAAVALILPLVRRFTGRLVFLVAALVPTAAFVFTLTQSSAMLDGGQQVEVVPWVPQLDLAIAVRLDTLSWVLALVVTGVGALVLLYCARYFSDSEEGLGRFASVLLAFAGAMYGLVVADDVFLLFIFWEATSVLSYLLIGHYTGRKASRGAALQALLVTTFGGLVMFVGLVLLAVDTGTSRLSEIVALAPSGPLVTTAVMLILVGAMSKSAIVPFHFWLPAAMAAPTPVSAYLHAAAMVKAGIYLIARLAPGFADTPGWQEVIVGFGVLTMLFGAWTALRQHDLKLVLAYGTVSQLGFLMVVAGFGTRDTALAGLALLLAHALYKSTLFLVVGIVDHCSGTRDLRKLSGLGRQAPVLATVTALALISMVGLPPALGFVAKEAVFTSLLEAGADSSPLGWVALVGVALGSALTVAYSARFFWGAFSTKPDVAPVKPTTEHADFVLAPALLALSGIVLGIAAPFVDTMLKGYADTIPATGEETYHLALWHGIEPALLISAGTLVVGALVFFWRGRSLQKAHASKSSAAGAYSNVLRVIDRTAARTTSVTQRGSLPFYLGVILTVFILAVGTALVLNRSWPTGLKFWDFPAQAAIGIIMIVAAIAATRATKRFQAVVLVGVTGYGMAGIFALEGAPDLALTQILVEIVTLVAFVLVLRRLPARLGVRNGQSNRIVRATVAIAFALVMGAAAIVALGARSALPISLEWPDLAYNQGHGRNVVNVALVDLRGWDTMGELSVIIVAATGVASLIFISGRTDNLPRLPRREAKQKIKAQRRSADAAMASGDDARTSWLLAGRTLAAGNRSILLEVVVRLIFHPILIVSIYLLFAGHNLPGGGFAGGLVAGLALVARYLAGGRHELGAAAPIDAGKLLGAGLTLAVGTALVPIFFGQAALQSSFIEGEVWLFGHVEFVTSTIFDVGVYLVVVGLTLDVLRSLGAEVDRQQEDDADSKDEPEKVTA